MNASLPHHLPRRAAAGALAAAALAAPAASARQAVDPITHDSAYSAPAPVVVADEGFQWSSAAIGAGGATLVLLLTAGGTFAATRRHKHDTTLGAAA